MYPDSTDKKIIKMTSNLFIRNGIIFLFSISTFTKNASFAASGIPEKFPSKTITQPNNGSFHLDSIPGVRKIKDVLIYEDATFYATFPSVIKRRDGELVVAFRRAPDRKIFGEKGSSHVDPNSYLETVHSKDGEHWTKNSELLYAHPFGGSQDPCMLQLRDGTILCASYGWAFVRADGIANLKKPYFESGGAIFLGGYLVKSADGGKTWSDAIYPLHVPSEIYYTAFGTPVPAYNRGALYEAKDGRILWIVAANDSAGKVSNHLIFSKDKGLTWEYSAPVAVDPKVSFNEASVIETPMGDIVGFLRTANYGDQAVIARSTDKGKSFKWQSMGFQGHPLTALRLPDNRVLLTYGYRHVPFGIRARILNADCTDFATAPEIVLRDDGGNSDLGYSWPVQLDKNRVLVVYYFNKANGTRHIAGTILEIK
jgi:sialidase-1